MMLGVLNYFFKNFVLKKNNFMKYNILERKYSKITSVNVNNWNSIHKEIIDKINDCDFVSIDVEYTGLHLKDERYISIDSSYEAHCFGAKSFFPCQIGITIAKKNDMIENMNNPTESKIIKKNLHNIKVLNNRKEKNIENDIHNNQKWNISPYCIYVFPKENKYFSVSTTTLIFLKENNFDFNEWIFNGVGYLRPNEEEEKKKNIIEKIDELKNLLNKCSTKTYNHEEKIDINKIINEIENNKIVDEEDKEAVIEIIKKIGIWINNDNTVNKKNNSVNEVDKSKNVQIKSSNYINTEDSDKSKDEKEFSSSFRDTDAEINKHKNYSLINMNKNYTDDSTLEEKVTYKNIMSNRVDCNNNNSNDNDDSNKHNSAFSNNENISNCEKTNDKYDIREINDISSYPLHIEVENPYLRLLAHTLITKYFNSIFCISVKVNDKKHLAIYRTEKDSYKEQIKSLELEIEKINQIIGVRLLFDEIIKNRKIIIGHNCFYDILHIYQTFYHDLPKSINEFKKKWTELFPHTFDTKFMNETNEYLYALNGPATLKGLCEYMATLISSSNDFDFFFNLMNDHFDLPQCFAPFINAKNNISFNEKVNNNSNDILEKEESFREKKKINRENNKQEYVSVSNNNNYNYSNREKYSINNSGDKNILSSDEHNAGYDSLLTCLLFIFQCHYILKRNNIMWKDIYFYKKNKINENSKCFFDIFLSMSNKIKIVKTQPNVVSLTSAENYEMARHFYMYDYPNYFKKWEIMKIWSPIWITLSKVDDQSCWIIAKSDDDAKNIKMIYKMLKNPQFKLCTYEEYLNKFKSK
ncbi:poly(A)-specific ribonuclease PARN, putative [Plasmodium relictum]|uniref:Poly(A)-specific ribonuclease PARN, putative n=1 Tax=Plasmodium relictum TaxID=85471 RepID=A0A1J1H999_PLARL|nr:poly(A)-specific ribonuclease PARN, putative [Plasmodium relictum]CRH01491.1 poly(A)-specific ribonuclease PARN, putative [Plasmodium relictum]